MVTAIIRFHGFFTNDYSLDPTWTAVQLIIITMAEPGIYLIAGCLLALRPLLKWSLERVPLSTLGFTERRSSQRSDKEKIILQKRSFKVAQNDQFQQLDDFSDPYGNRAEARRGDSV
jgi:hypothetical protein